MAQVTPRVRRALDNLPVSLLVVPLALSLTKLDQLRAVTRFRGIHLGLRPSLPTAVGMALTMATLSFFDDKHGRTPRQAAEDPSPGESPDSL